MARDLKDLRVLLVHEWLYTWAGAERVLDALAAIVPHADVLAGIVTPGMRAAHPVAHRAKETWVGAIPGAHRHHRWFLPLHALAFAGADTSRYDLVISISHAFEKAVRARDGATHVCYCLSPPRWLWDMKDEHADMATLPQRVALETARPILRAADRAAAAGVHEFISISQHVADRVKRCYGRDSAVVYPPVAANVAPSQPEPAAKPFLLSLGRLVPYKRVDLAVQAAERLGLRLVVAGEGPERARLERLAGRCTEFTGAVSDAEAARLRATCAAFVFCAEEDFGIAPLEANAAGKPVVAFRRGAAAETLRDGENAVFFERQDVDAVVDAINRCLATRWDAQAITRSAQRFAGARFHDEMQSALLRAVERR